MASACVKLATWAVAVQIVHPCHCLLHSLVQQVLSLKPCGHKGRHCCWCPGRAVLQPLPSDSALGYGTGLVTHAPGHR